jgi:toxin HigB-1
MIVSFADASTRRLYEGWEVPRFAGFSVSAFRKLLILDAAVELNDLRSPPGNRLEKLKGKRSAQHSIRINQQWRVCFRWTVRGAEDVEIVDYH